MSPERRSPTQRRAITAALGTYRPLFAVPGARPRIALSLLGRLSIGVLDIPLLLVVAHATHSYGLAGLTVGLDGAGIALGAPRRGRALDRHGSRPTIVVLAVLRAATIAALWPIALTGHAALILPLAVIAGLVVPPLPASMRLQWKRLLAGDEPLLERAAAFETVAQVSLFVVGPALAAVGISIVGPGPTLLAAAAVLLAGALSYAARTVDDRTVGETAPNDPQRRVSARPLARPGVRTLITATLLADAALGFIDVTVTAYAREHGHASVAGLALAGFALSGVLWGALYGARDWRLTARRRLAVVTLAAAVLYLPLIAAPTLAWLAGGLILAGAPAAAQWATTYLVLDDVAPAQATGEALSWMSAANAAGVGVGDAVAGVIIDAANVHVAFATAAGLLLLAGLWLAARQRSLTP